MLIKPSKKIFYLDLDQTTQHLGFSRVSIHHNTGQAGRQIETEKETKAQLLLLGFTEYQILTSTLNYPTSFLLR